MTAHKLNKSLQLSVIGVLVAISAALYAPLWFSIRVVQWLRPFAITASGTRLPCNTFPHTSPLARTWYRSSTRSA